MQTSTSFNLLSKKRNRFTITNTSRKANKTHNTYINKITNYFPNKKLLSEETSTKKHSLIKEKTISQETLQFLTEFFNQKHPREKKQIHILQTYPLKKKYSNLIERKLHLPVKFLQLIENFQKIEKEIFESRELKIKVNLKQMEIIKHINTIWPQCYHIEENELNVWLDNTQMEQDKRLLFFKNILTELVKAKHDIFIKENGIEFPCPYSVGTWHSSFDIENCLTSLDF